jgi:hypothetical protein
MKFKLLALLITLVLLSGCSTDDTTCPDTPLFSISPIHPDSIRNIDPVGNLNPPGHVFPSDHGGFYIKEPPGAKVTYNVQVFAPGDLIIIRARALQHVNAGITDFSLDFQYCDDMRGNFGHVNDLDPDTFGELADHTQWAYDGEYSTGGETYRNWVKPMRLKVSAGDRLGTTGGNPGQGGMDFGVYDRTADPIPAARPSRWSDGMYRYSFHFLDYYEEGAVKDELMALVNREDIPGDPYPTGRALQDVPGTAMGCWFKPGAPYPPEDAHLALVQSHYLPSKEMICTGTSIPSLPTNAYFFEPQSSGLLNRAFADVRPDDRTYGYVIMWPERTVFITLPDADTLWIEAIDGEHPDPADWIFTDDKVVFVR